MKEDGDHIPCLKSVVSSGTFRRGIRKTWLNHKMRRPLNHSLPTGFSLYLQTLIHLFLLFKSSSYLFFFLWTLIVIFSAIILLFITENKFLALVQPYTTVVVIVEAVPSSVLKQAIMQIVKFYLTTIWPNNILSWGSNKVTEAESFTTIGPMIPETNHRKKNSKRDHVTPSLIHQFMFQYVLFEGIEGVCAFQSLFFMQVFVFAFGF